MTETFSNTKVWSFPIDDLIRDAFERVGGGHIVAEETQSARRSLNIILQDISNRGATLGQIKMFSVPVSSSVASYTLKASISDVLDMTFKNTDDVSHVMDRMPFVEFNTLSNKDSTFGKPSQFTTTRGVSNISLRVYPVPTSVQEGSTLEFYAITYPDTIKEMYELARVSRRYYPALVYGLAYEMALKRPKPSQANPQILKAQYEEHLAYAMQEDRERSSFFVVPKRV